MLYFYNGLFDEDARMLNASSGGCIVNKTTLGAKELLSELAEGSM